LLYTPPSRQVMQLLTFLSPVDYSYGQLYQMGVIFSYMINENLSLGAILGLIAVGIMFPPLGVLLLAVFIYKNWKEGR